MHKEFHHLLSLEGARAVVLEHTPAPGEEEVSLKRALGRVLAERVVSGIEVPGFDRASMDGYALRAEDSLAAREDRPAELELVGRVAMGTLPEVVIGPGQAAEVSTGAMMPPGADAVVMVEHSEVEGMALQIRRPVHGGENVLKRASDIGLGETVLYPGTRLTQREIGVLAALGRAEVPVRRLQVGVASTGNELVMPGGPLGPGKVYDINSYAIASAVEEAGATPKIYDILPDDHDHLTRSLERICEEMDMVLVSGSTSAGAGDMLYRVVEELGELIFHGINLKPGKPTIFGIINGKPVYGLPGYPTSALTVFSQLVAPVIYRSLGLEIRGMRAEGRLARPVRSEGRRQMLAVGIVHGMVYPVDKGSGSITTLSRSDGVIEIPPAVEYIERGERVRVRLFGDLADPGLFVAGEDCPALEVLARALPFEIRIEAKGSRQGALWVEDGLADVAFVSSSSFVSSTDSAGPSWQKDLFGLGEIPENLAVIRGYSRELGLISREPLDLRELDRLKVPSWPKDGEMYGLFEEALKGRSVSGVPEYVGSARSHSAMAAAVASGKVDAAFGARGAAEEMGLRFAKLTKDCIHFLVRRDRLEEEFVKAFISALRSREFEGRLPPGMRAQEGIGTEIVPGKAAPG